MVTADATKLIGRLRGALRRQRLVLLAAGLLTTVATVTGMALLLALVAGVMIVPVWLKIGLLALTGAVTAWALLRFVARRFWYGSVDQMAIRLEQLYPELKGRLIAAVQFARMKVTPGYSPELMAITARQAVELSSNLDFSRSVRFGPVWRSGRAFLAAGAVAVLVMLISPGLFRHSLEVYSNPTEEIAPPLGYDLYAWPGSTEWVKYRDIEIGGSLVGGQFPQKATIHHRLAGGSWQQTEIDLREFVPTVTGAGDSLLFTTTLRQINRSFDYYVEAGRSKTEVQKVDVVDRPRVNGIKLSIFYPTYTGLDPTVIDENNGSFSAVVGSRVTMELESSMPIKQAEMVFEDSSRQAMEVTNRRAETSLRVDESRAYWLRLTDHLGEHNPDPIEYYITAVPDEYPSVDVLFPGVDVNLTDEMRLPLKLRIYDDYGFSSLVMKYTVFNQGRPSDENVAVINFSDRIKTEGDIDFKWDLGGLNMFPGDWVAYYFEVADNDQVSGPKVSRSRQFVARIPSLDEIVSMTEAESQRRVMRTQKILEEGRETAQKMKQLARKLQAQQKKAEWQRQKELNRLAEKNAETIENIEKMAQEMEKSVDRMAQQSYLSREILEKMSQIQKLFEEVATPEMKEAQRELMEALKNMDPAEMQKAMEDFQVSMEEMLQRLERTLTLLKHMQLEQKMEAVLRQLEQLVERQESMNQTTDSTGEAKLPSLSRQEDQIKSDLQSLKEQAEALDSLSKEAELNDVPQMQEFMEALKQNDADMNMSRMSQALSQKQKQDAKQQGNQALSKLLETLDQMQQSLSDLKGQNQDEMMRAMQMAIDDANYLSRTQEELYDEAAQMSQESTVLREMAQRQKELQGACDGLKNRISELGEQSPFIAAELERLVDFATSCMQQGTEQFTDKRKNRALQAQRDAMANLNLAALRLMESMQQQQQCNKGGNCSKNLKKLQSLCKKQQSLNQKTQSCANPSSSCNNPGQAGGQGNPQFSMQGREGLERLAGEQGAIRKSLEELAREFGDSRQVLGRLDDLAREMREVEEELASGDVGRETVERQLKIYSRMLQASRSLQRRDFTEQRQSKSAETQLYAPPPALPDGILDNQAGLEDRLREYLSEDYPPQYEQQIKAYFRALMKTQGRNATGEEIQQP